MKTFLIVMILTGHQPAPKAFEFPDQEACETALKQATMPKRAPVVMFCSPTQESTLLAPTRNRKGMT